MLLLTLLAGAIGTVVFAALFTHWLWYARVGGPKPIPGPPQLPVLGHVHLIMPHITNFLPLFHAWAVKYVCCVPPCSLGLPSHECLLMGAAW
jgi:hypothetical protein